MGTEKSIRRSNGRANAPLVSRRLAVAGAIAILSSLWSGRSLAGESAGPAGARSTAGPADTIDASNADAAEGSTQTYTAFYTAGGDKRSIEFERSIPQVLASLDSHAYDPTLSYMLAAVSAAAYSKECIVLTLRGLGFDDAEAHYYYDNPDDERYPDDAVAYGIGKAEDAQNGPVYIVAARGSYGSFDIVHQDRSSSDWRSNFNVGEANGDGGGVHKGFDLAAERLYEGLSDNAGTPLDTDARYVACGHSRGTAVANLLATKLIDRGVPQDRVYCYTFACPDVARLAWRPAGLVDRYACVFNINNAADPITYSSDVFDPAFEPPAEGELSWGKFGNSIWFSSNWSRRSSVLPDLTYAAHLPPVYLEYLAELPDIGEMLDFSHTIMAMRDVRKKSSIRARLEGLASSLLGSGD